MTPWIGGTASLTFEYPNACLRLGSHQLPETGCFSSPVCEFRRTAFVMVTQLECVNPTPVLNVFWRQTASSGIPSNACLPRWPAWHAHPRKATSISPGRKEILPVTIMDDSLNWRHCHLTFWPHTPTLVLRLGSHLLPETGCFPIQVEWVSICLSRENEMLQPKS